MVAVPATKLESDLKRNFTGKTQREFLKRAGLPLKYRNLTSTEQREARMRTLRGWYDPSKPNVLCTDPDAFVRAHFLWCEWYYKPADINKGTYFWNDPTCKYEIVRTTMLPSLEPEAAAKTVFHAPRRICKTQTVVVEQLPLIAITRPFSPVLLSESTAERTSEEVDKIKGQIENNDRIHRDFGGRGKLWPKSNHPSLRWKSTRLDFPCCHGSSIFAHSIGSAQRGRGPIYGVVDDPEDDDTTYSKDWRKKFFERLFHVYLRMFHWGGKIVWIGTVIHGRSCLSLALEGLSEQEEEQDHVIRDKRFRDWHKMRFRQIETDEKGERYSIQPQRLTVAGFDRQMEVDPAGVMAELQGMPVSPGSLAFHFDDQGAHGYMHCKPSKEHSEDYFLDLKTGRIIPWKEFLKPLRVFHGGDVGDGVSADSDPGAIVTIGVCPAAIRYVLDCVVKVCFAERLVEEGMNLALLWGVERWGWERAANQLYVVRIAENLRAKMEKKGLIFPQPEGIPNNKKEKVVRVLSMRPMFGSETIRFPLSGEFTDRKGITHVSVEHPHRMYINILKAQIRDFTDEGIRGHDDAVDALEMAIRLSSHVRAVEPEPDRDPTSAQLLRWEKAGVDMEARLPHHMWTNDMVIEHERLLVGVAEKDEGEYDFWEDCCD